VIAPSRRLIASCLVLMAASLLISLLGLAQGPVPLTIDQVFSALFGDAPRNVAMVVNEWRLPRVLMALLIGAALGVSGAIFQSLTRNPLGSPDVMGFNTGAWSGVLVAMVLFGQNLTAIALAAIFQPSVWIVSLVIAMVNWVQIARVIYAETSALSARDFIAVERTLGAGTLRILGVHLIPHLAPTVLVWATLGISTTVLLEATLSFLGVGVQPPTPSWGNIIFESQSYFTSAPWLVFFPGAAIVLLSLSFNFAGDALRDALDPGLKGRN